MKKTIAILILLVLTFSIVPVNASAEDEFTREEAEALFENAFICYVALQESWYAYHHVNASVELIPGYGFPVEGTILWDGKPYVYESDTVKIDKFIINGREFVIDSLSDINDLIETYYVPGFYDVFTKGQNFLQGKVDLFYEGPDGDAYCIWDQGEEGWVHLTDEKGSPLSFGAFTVSGDKATLYARAKIMFGGTVKTESYFFEAPVEFTKTADGWRVSGGTMVSIYSRQTSYEPYVYKHLHYDPDADTFTEVPLNPNTGDNTLATAALLVTVALAAFITHFAISKKRRVR